MKLVKLKAEFFQKCKATDNEVLDKIERPYVLIIKLKYNGEKLDFAIPLRTNIPASEQKNMYYVLPTRSKTRDKNRHGLHFRKIIPVKKQYLEKYIIFENNDFDKIIQEYINKNIKNIVLQAQDYLNYYNEHKPLKFSTNIEELIKILYED